MIANCAMKVILIELDAVHLNYVVRVHMPHDRVVEKVISFDERDASLVPPGSSMALAQAIGALLATTPVSDARPELRASLRARFDWDVVAARYGATLAGVIAAPGKIARG